MTISGAELGLSRLSLSLRQWTLNENRSKVIVDGKAEHQKYPTLTHVSFTDLPLHLGDIVLYSHPTHISRELDFMQRSQDSNRCFLQRDAYVRGGWCVNPQHDDDNPQMGLLFFFFP